MTANPPRSDASASGTADPGRRRTGGRPGWRRNDGRPGWGRRGRPGRRGRGRLGRWLCLYLPLVVWLGVIAVNSTDLASAAHTDQLLLRLVHVFFPEQETADSSGFEAASLVLRKAAHVVEYGILAILLARVVRALVPGVVRSTGRELLWKTSRVVIPGCLLVAALDELHQGLVASRSGALSDVAFDLAGMVLGVLAVWLVWRREPPPGSASPARRASSSS